MQDKNQEYLTEEWKPIQGFEEDFEISSFGRIKRLASNTLKLNRSKLGKVFWHNTKVKEKILKPTLQRNGYFLLRTAVNGTRVSFMIHQEVARAFVTNSECKPIVNHIDGCKTNNNYYNLEWCTVSENAHHHHKTKTYDTFGKIAKAFTGSVTAYNKDTGEFVCIMSGSKEMKESGFDFRLVSAVLTGKRKSHNGCYFTKDSNKLETSQQQVSFSKGNFKPLDVFDKEGTYMFTLETYQEVLDKGLTPQRVSDTILGKAKQHKGLIFKLKEEINNDSSIIKHRLI